MYVLPVVGTSVLEGLGGGGWSFIVVVDLFIILYYYIFIMLLLFLMLLLIFYLTLFCYREFQERQQFSIKMCSDISAFCCSCRTQGTRQLMSYIIVSTNHTIGLWFSISSLRTQSGGDCLSKEERTPSGGVAKCVSKPRPW